MAALSADELMAYARSATGLDDFGDASFEEGLRVYCASVADSALNEFGGLAIPGTVIAALTNRLNVVEYLKQHPEVADETISAPLIVVGMFRAGTTLLSNLLEQDPRNRALLRWESSDSVPPADATSFREGPRVDAAQAGNDILESVNPRVRAIHHEEANGPTECIAVMSQDFKSLSWEAISNVPEYGRWLLETDHTSAYRYHRQVLQILQSGGVRGRWTLKSPHHAIALDALMAVYPDARLVVLHRDPAVLAASVCSLINTLSATFTDADHRPYIAQHWVDDVLTQSVERLADFRRRRPDVAVLDVLYDDLMADPVAMVGRIYAAADTEGTHAYDEATAAAVGAYVAAHPKNEFGAHRYGLADYGLNAAALREQFSGYIERYGVPLSSSIN